MRDSLSKLWRMYYQYGYFKPLVSVKARRRLRARQLVPSMFVLSVFGSAVVTSWFAPMRMIALVVLATYVMAMVGCSAWAAWKRGVRCALALCLIFPVLHVSYDLGFLKGVVDFVILERQAVAAAKMPISR